MALRILVHKISLSNLTMANHNVTVQFAKIKTHPITLAAGTLPCLDVAASQLRGTPPAGRN